MRKSNIKNNNIAHDVESQLAPSVLITQIILRKPYKGLFLKDLNPRNYQ